MASNVGLPGDGRQDQGWKLYVASLVMVIASGCVVLVRCAARLATQHWGADDYTIVASLAFSIVLSVTINLAVVHGYGEHVTELSKPQLHLALKWFFIAQAPYKVAVCLYKISVVLFYKRIFVVKAFQTACWIVLGIVVSWGIAVIFATIFQCIPVAGAWDTSLNARCINTDAFWVGYAVSNVLTDVMVLSLPIPSILQLHLNIRERVLLLGVFLLGGFVVICGILRTTSVANSLHNRQDITYNFIPRGIWTLVEANVGIICACLPILKHPFSRGLARLWGTVHSSRKIDSRESADASELRSHKQTSQKPSKRGQPAWLLSKDSRKGTVNGDEPIELMNNDQEHIIPKTAETGHTKPSFDELDKAEQYIEIR